MSRIVKSPIGRLVNKLAVAKVRQQEGWEKTVRMASITDALAGEYADPTNLSLLHLQTPHDLSLIDLACDSDFGGSSKIDMSLVEGGREDESEGWSGTGDKYAVASGRISLAVRKELAGKVRGGLVGFRTADLEGLWTTKTVDLSQHTHLSLMVRPGGDPRLWPHWYVNIQMNGFVPEELYVHRLGLTGSGEAGDGWEECEIPLSNFVLTKQGGMSANQSLEIPWDNVKSIGLSLLAAPRSDPYRHSIEEAGMYRKVPEGVEGDFELGVGQISAVYRSPKFTSRLPPVYDSPPSLAHFHHTLPVPPSNPKYPTFAEARWRSAQTSTYERGNYPSYAGKDKKGPLPGARPTELVEAAGSEKGGAAAKDRGPSLADKIAGKRKNLGLSQEELNRRLEQELS